MSAKWNGKMGLCLTGVLLAFGVATGCETRAPAEISDEVAVGPIGDDLRDLFQQGKADEVVEPSAPVTRLMPSDLEASKVEATGIVFESPSDRVRGLRKGDLISSADLVEPFLRRITLVQYEPRGSTAETAYFITFETEDVRLGEVIAEALTKQGFELPVLDKSFDGLELARAGLSKVVCEVCSVKLSPRFDFGFQLKKGSLEAFLGTLSGDIESKVRLTAEVSAGDSLDKETELTSFSRHFTQLLGSVPVWEDVSVSLRVGVKGKFKETLTLKAGLSARQTLRTEMGFQSGKWVMNNDAPNSLTFEKIDISAPIGAGATFYIKTRIAIKIYSVLGLWLSGNVSAEVGVKPCPAPATWTGNGQVSLTAGAGLETSWFDRSVEKTLYARDYPQTGPLTLPFTCP